MLEVPRVEVAALMHSFVILFIFKRIDDVLMNRRKENVGTASNAVSFM